MASAHLGESARYVRIVLLSAAFASRGVSGDRPVADALDDGEKCAGTSDAWPCLRGAGSRAADSVLGFQGDIPLFGSYLTVVHRPGRTPRTETPAGNASATSVYSKLLDFAESRALRVLLPVESVVRLLVGPDDRTSEAEGRDKKNKGGSAGVLALGGMMLITTLLSAAFGALALLASKALMTSILALMLSAMAVVKKSGGGHHAHARTTYEVINGIPSSYHQATNFKLEDSAVIPDINAQYGTGQTEPVQFANQQYD
ncbi:Protein of unknown function DUF1676 [Cinara cedri]|uniref:Uncharacterized protein n=1 Tax=Cinara cedri TaxID=506608 RepID=A0A5E4MPR3_9HEMI|nr:Protein of unknown function DUF1676 [Cinara cedri]